MRKGRSGYSQLIPREDVTEEDIQITSDVTAVVKLKGVGGRDPKNLFWEVATAHVGGAGGGEPGDPSLVLNKERKLKGYGLIKRLLWMAEKVVWTRGTQYCTAARSIWGG